MNCPVCDDTKAEVGSKGGDLKQVDCRTCGRFEISRTAVAMLGSRINDKPQSRARLMHAVNKRARATPWFRVDSANLDTLISESLPKPARQIENLLFWLSERLEDNSQGSIEISDAHVLIATIGVLDEDQVYKVLKEANEQGLINWEVDDSFELTYEGWKVVEKMESQIEESPKMISTSTSRTVVIGHGRSKEWLELKAFLNDRLKLQCIEFNSSPVAGYSTKERLQQMLDQGGMAFIVMTAEDETADKKKNPRMNVVHEAGLFQGKFGFERAIILLEEGCEEFSNIVGLSQLRFHKDRIKDSFEEVRGVLEREGFIPSG